MTALVTGGGGFIGSHLVEHLLQQGEQVVVLDDFSSGHPDNLDHLVGSDDVALVRGSILDAKLVDDLVGRCDVVYHLAAAVGVKMINEQPLESLRVNIHGTEIVLESAAAHGTPILFASTSETYGKNYDVPLGEQHDRVLGSLLEEQVVVRRSQGHRRVHGLQPLALRRAARRDRAAVQHRRTEADGALRDGRAPIRRSGAVRAGPHRLRGRRTVEMLLPRRRRRAGHRRSGRRSRRRGGRRSTSAARRRRRSGIWPNGSSP